MKTRYEIKITAQDCADAVRNNVWYCVVSTAIGRLQPEANRIQTDRYTIRFTLKDGGKTYRLVYPAPPVVADYVRNFDAGAEPTPMEFVLDNPQVVERPPTPAGKARTPSFKPQGAAATRRSVRVFGEKALRPVK